MDFKKQVRDQIYFVPFDLRATPGWINAATAAGDDENVVSTVGFVAFLPRMRQMWSMVFNDIRGLLSPPSCSAQTR